MEEKLTAEIHALQSELNTKEETLQSRDNQINDLKSNVDLLLKQAKESEIAIDQAKTEAVTEAKRVEQLTEASTPKSPRSKPR
jgi:chromosome segregation ATPase